MSKTHESKKYEINTVIIVGFACLLIGFLGGALFMTLDSNPSGSQQPYPTAFSAPASPTPTAQQTERILTLEKMTSTDPKNSEAWLELGNLYFDSSLYQKAIQAYNSYLEINPDNPDAWTDLGVMYRRTNRPQDAITAFDKAISLAPRHQQSRFNKGVVLMSDLKNPEAAFQVWEELAKINPGFRTPGGRTIQDILNTK
jgi:tetratricopeptide (TPR) repeat protein